MTKAEIIRVVLEAVVAETGVCMKTLVSQDKRREVVDARHIAINLLHKHGIYITHIAGVFRATVRNIRYALSCFDTRISFSPPMRSDYERIKKTLGRAYEIA